MDTSLDSLNLDFTETIDTLVAKTAAYVLPAKQAVADIFTSKPAFVFWHPVLEKVALLTEGVTNSERQWLLEGLYSKFAEEQVQQDNLQLADLDDYWVKVAHSPLLRGIGQAAQIFPSSWSPVGGKPIAATIASGVLGAGLGYGAGWLGEKLIPEEYAQKGRLRKNLARMGGLAGTVIGATPGLINLHDGRSFNDDTLWNKPLAEKFEPDLLFKKAIAYTINKQASYAKPDEDTLGGPSFHELPLIHLDSLGNVLWGTKHNPTTTAMTIGTVYGAAHMPDHRASPGIVTPHQTGLLGMAMGAAGGGLKGYIAGRAVGIGLGLLTGLPEKEQNRLGRTGAMLGVVNSLVPHLFR